jgi:imidazolonepropionase-like amidohydrolase
MTAWRFEGIGLPDGDRVEWTVGVGNSESLPGQFALTGLVDAHCHLTVDDDAEEPFRRI